LDIIENITIFSIPDQYTDVASHKIDVNRRIDTQQTDGTDFRRQPGNVLPIAAYWQCRLKNKLA